MVKTNKQNELNNFSNDSNYQSIFMNIDWDNFTISELEKIKIPNSVMKNGLVFIWSEKYLLSEIMDIFEKQNFKYVENLVISQLDKEKISQKLKTENLKEIINNDEIEFDINEILKIREYEYFNISNKTLLIFRRNIDKSILELRHQRNSDSFFDIFDSKKPNGISDEGINRIYDTIETMLPKAKSNYNYGFIQLFGQPSKRNNWINFDLKN